MALTCCILSGLNGCDSAKTRLPDRVILDIHASGNGQSGKQGEILPLPLRVTVEGPVEPGLFGGKGDRRAVAGVGVRFEILDPASRATLTPGEGTAAEVSTDRAGSASVSVALGAYTGDVEILASLVEYPDIEPVRFRVVSGVDILGSNLEGAVSATLHDVGVRILNPDGTPAENLDVYFRTESGKSSGADVSSLHVLTDSKGEATTDWKLGKEIGINTLSAEVEDRRPGVALEERLSIRSIEFTAMALDKQQMIIVLLGGLAIFLFGMKMMSDGLQRLADKRLRSVLQFLTQNRVMAVFAGAMITGLIQSSSASTVMTVGFVNAGLLSLQQAIGVIFGANIGTTVTAQIIAFKLEELAYPAICIGLVMMMASRRVHIKYLGETLLGFGLLFLGMMGMSDILKPLSHSPEFISWFQLFDCTPAEGGFMHPGRVFMCILTGTLTTVVVQSSSATVGLVLALSSQGLIGFYTAVPLILGDNIGTTITANLAAIGANRNARRAALAHTLFNVFGACYMYVLFFVPLWDGHPVFLGLVDWATPGDVFGAHEENILRHVANAHSLFNVVNVIICLGFTGLLARMCYLIIPYQDTERDSVLVYLEPKLLSTPSIALQQAVKEVVYMVRKGQKSMNESCDLLCDGKEEYETSILEREDVIDRLQKEVTAYLVDLSQAKLDGSQSALIPALIHAVNDAERLGDHAEAQVELYLLLKEGKFVLPEESKQDIRKCQAHLNEKFEIIYKTLEDGKMPGGSKARKLDRQLQNMMRDFTEAHVQRLERGECEVQTGVIYLDALAHLERVGDHLLNIAERADTVLAVTSA